MPTPLKQLKTSHYFSCTFVLINSYTAQQSLVLYDTAKNVHHKNIESFFSNNPSAGLLNAIFHEPCVKVKSFWERKNSFFNRAGSCNVQIWFVQFSAL